MLQGIFWFLMLYFLYKFVFGFVVPLVVATRKVRSQMKDMRENMGEFQSSNKSATDNYSSHTTKTTSNPAPKGDYIDFEEIKE